MEPITTTKELGAACTRLAKHDFITVDTEFLRETTYFPILCVAQVASADEAIVIDALAEGIDLAPFFKLMANEKVLKVFHAARQDFEIVWHRAKMIPHPVFDAQVADAGAAQIRCLRRHPLARCLSGALRRYRKARACAVGE